MSQPNLNTDRLLLTQLEYSDWQMVSFLRSDEVVNKYVKRPTAASKKEALLFINKICDGISSESHYYWKICTKQDPKMMGSICLWNFSENREIAEVGYDLSPEFQGRGIMQEALSKTLDFGFQELNINSVEAFTHRGNAASIKLLERNKFILQPGREDEFNRNNIIYRLTKT